MITADDRYQVSLARMKILAMSTRIEVRKFDEMEVKVQLKIARQDPFSGLAGIGQDQDGAKDPLQDQKNDPWPW